MSKEQKKTGGTNKRAGRLDLAGYVEGALSSRHVFPFVFIVYTVGRLYYARRDSRLLK